jgi:hypothetical protein
MHKREYSCITCEVFVTVAGKPSSVDKLRGDDVRCVICDKEMELLSPGSILIKRLIED